MAGILEDATIEALAAVFMKGFKAGYEHGVCLSDGAPLCDCELCGQAAIDPDFAVALQIKLAEAGIPPKAEKSH